nr:MAG TPA: hypothetical protein [Caudoviricetes sp.]
MLSDFYKENPTDKVWWISNIDTFGEHLFSFDKKVIFNLFRDYPHNLTKEQKEIFDSENPYWANFFKWRTEEGK